MRIFINFVALVGVVLAYQEINLINDLSETFDLTINDCAREGKISKDCKTLDFESLKVAKTQRDFCQKAFWISCMEKKLDDSCQAGEEAAKKRQNCDRHESDTFKKCCNACRMGIEFMEKTNECSFETTHLGEQVKSIASRCCKSGFDSEEYDEYTNVVAATQHAAKSNSLETPVIQDFPTYIQDPSVDEAPQVSECLRSNPCKDKEYCVDTKIGMECKCKSGYKSQYDGECTDIDECEEGLDGCDKLNKKCENTKGSFKCRECLNGFEISSAYEYDENTNHYVCEDVDECKYNLCPWKCQNTKGSYICQCPNGYISRGNSCDDIDECEGNVCKKDEVCSNVNGSYRCSKFTCPIGYRPINSTNCVLSSCRHDICHKTVTHLIKTLAANDFKKEIYRTTASSIKASMNVEYFEMLMMYKEYVVTQKKPLKQDEVIELKFKQGRFQKIVNIHVFVSKYGF